MTMSHGGGVADFVVVRCPLTSVKVRVGVDNGTTVGKVKQAAAPGMNMEPQQMQLRCRGQILTNNFMRLAYYGVRVRIARTEFILAQAAHSLSPRYLLQTYKAPRRDRLGTR